MTVCGPSLRSQIDHIASSELLRGCESLRRILIYLAEQSVRFPGIPAKESAIAIEALGRAADFNPRTDASVRVNVGRLRSRLLRYYAGPGANDPIRITIPRGVYLLAVEAREQAPITPARAIPVYQNRRFATAVLIAAGIFLGLALTFAMH